MYFSCAMKSKICWRIHTLFDSSIFFSCAMEFDDLMAPYFSVEAHLYFILGFIIFQLMHLYFIWRSIFFSWRIYTLFDASIFFSCAMEFDDLLTLLRQSGTSIEIPTDDDYECTVLFLWNRKKTNSTSTSVATNIKNNKGDKEMTDVNGKN